MNGKKILILVLMVLTACEQKKKEEPKSQVETKVPKYLYVSSGLCYSGTVATFTATTASNQSYRLNLSTGQKDTSFADYYSVPANPGDSPVAMLESDASSLVVLVENATSGRRIEKLAKSANASRSIFTSNSTALSAVLRGMAKTSDGGYLVAKTAGIEKITSQGIRLGAPYIGTSLGATCGATNANINTVTVTPSGKIIYTNAAASNNRWGIISANGYLTAADCLAAQASPDVNAQPVAVQYIASHNQILVAYAGNSLAVNLNSIYVYDFNDTTNVISNPVKIYDSNTYLAAGYLLFGISSMVYNPDDQSLYIATTISNATTAVNYSIEKLAYNPDAKSLSRAQATPFYSYGVDTKCISSMRIAE
ncbi:MAG: hypothetical protein JNL11_11210 [Bdellovibrionaceae bacterium]|nr:hypothetical protein [Pseudobdellovibrionaceae bacterium]